MAAADVTDGSPAAGTPVRVFLSYAHESDEHAEAVRDLWILLRRCGIDARLDRPAAERPQDWPIWMMEQVREADFVLVVASAAYRRRAEGLAAANEGRGVQFEAVLIREAVYSDRAVALARVLPVVLPGMSADGIPVFLGPTTTTHYEIPAFTVDGIEPLLRVLTDQPGDVEPPVGSVPAFGTRASPLSSETSVPLVRHELTISVTVDGGQVTARTELAGTLLGERSGPVPAGFDRVWDGLAGPADVVDSRLADAGRRLGALLFDEETARRIVDLADLSPFGSTVDIVIKAAGEAAAWPYELLRLDDGRVLATLPAVRVRRQVPGAQATTVAPLPGPLKILAAVAAPEETRTANVPLDVEAEMQAVLDAVSTLPGSSADVQVKILEVAGPDQIEQALRADQYHVLHLSAHGSPGSIELADEDGDPMSVDAATLAGVLRAGQRPLPLVVLSSCAGAGRGTDGLAAHLIEHGADRVLAMQAAVSDPYATALARRLYRTLADDPTGTPGAALAGARRALEAERVERLRAGAVVQPEYGVATLLCAGGDPPLVDARAPGAGLSRPTTPPPGRSVLKLRMGELIGRRGQLRTAVGVLRRTPAAVRRWGERSGVMLTGIGGIGKTAIAGRVLARLADDGWLTAVHVGTWSPQTLISEVARAISGRTELAQVFGLLTTAEVDDTAKVDIVRQLLIQAPLLLVFDDFEQNLTPGGDAFRDPGFAEVFEKLYVGAQVGGLVVTCRYPVPDAGDYLLPIPVPALSAAELGRFLLRLGSLDGLERADRQILAATVGGHPRLIEFVDALLRQPGRGRLPEVTRRLRKLAADQPSPVDLTVRRDLTQAVEDAILLGSRDILLAELLALLTPDEREILLQAAVSTLPLTIEDLTRATWAEDPTPTRLDLVRRAAPRLVDLTLLAVTDAGVAIHPWVAAALLAHQTDQFDRRHRRAESMRVHRLRNGRAGFDDLVEIARHQAATRRYDDLCDFAQAVAGLLANQMGELSVAAFLGQALPLIPTDHPGYLCLADREFTALIATGNISAAQGRARALVAVARTRADAEPTGVEPRHNLGVFSERLGDVAVAVGNLTEAEHAYRDSLTIAVELAEAHPLDPQVQRQLSVIHTKLGDLAVTIGNLTEAEHAYRDSLGIRVRLAEADPTNADAQRDLSVSHNRLGDVARAVGNLAEAERAYRDSLAIAVRLAAADPTNAHIQRDLSISHERLGDVARAVGNLAEAERAYRDSFGIRVRLADADPTNAQARADLSVSYNRLGDVARAVGNLTEAERAYREGLAIAVRVADADPTNAEAQRDLSISHNKLGDVAHEVGNLTEAERAYRDSLSIRVRLAEADPTNAQAQRDLSVSYDRLGEVAEVGGNLTEAERAYRDSLSIRVRLAEADPTNADAQRDLRISHHRLGDVARAVGRLAEAECSHRASLAIAVRLAEADPTNVQTQADLSFTRERLGDVLAAVGNPAEAERAYRGALAVTERMVGAESGDAQRQRMKIEKLGGAPSAQGPDDQPA